MSRASSILGGLQHEDRTLGGLQHDDRTLEGLQHDDRTLEGLQHDDRTLEGLQHNDRTLGGGLSHPEEPVGGSLVQLRLTLLRSWAWGEGITTPGLVVCYSGPGKRRRPGVHQFLFAC